MKRMLRSGIVVAAVALLLFPYIQHVFQSNPGIIGVPHPDPLIEGDSDVYEESWHFWWVSRALGSGSDPRFCDLVDPPDGISLVYQHIGWTDTFLFAFLGLGHDHPVLSYDLSLLLGTLLTALFGWLLARSWGLSPTGALFAAFAIAWLPSRTAHLLQHYQIANCWALIAAMWLCRSYLTHKGALRLTGFGIAAMAAGMQSPFFFIFILISIAATVFIGRYGWKSGAILYAAMLPVLAALLLMVFTGPGRMGSLSMGWREAIYWSAEPQSYLLPSPFGPFGRLIGLSAKVSWMPNAAEGVVSPGLVVMGLLFWFIWKKRGWRFAAVICLLYILALGPELRIFGRSLGIPLPFRILQALPLMEGIRAPSRFAILGGVLAVLGAGLALTEMKKRTALVFLGLMMAELFVPVLPAVSSRIPEECSRIEAGAVVLELPVEPNARRYSLFQTASGYTRIYSFLARPEQTETPEDLMRSVSRADIVLYHRWLMEPMDRILLDSLYATLFPGADPGDSIWTAVPGEDGWVVL